MKENYDYPGWPLSDNPYNSEFDLEARKRMAKGSHVLFPLIKKYKNNLGKVILEVGPFFNPLITPKEFPNKLIFYWENDRHVLKWISKEHQKNVFPIYCDLNKIEGNSLLKLKLETQKLFNNIGKKKIVFDSVIISHVFNYIDYKLFLMVLKDFLKPNAYIFINNVVDYGLPTFFSNKRPKSVPEILKTLKETGYKIIEKTIYDSPNKKHQKNKRLILVAVNS